jgi:hypothetical protein
LGASLAQSREAAALNFNDVDSSAELANAITTANASPESDDIEISGIIDVGHLPIIDPQGNPSITIHGDDQMADVVGNTPTLFFVRSGSITFRDMTMSQTSAGGGFGFHGGGGGLGAGGAIFVYEGNVTIERVLFLGNSAAGGQGGSGEYGGGGGGSLARAEGGENGGGASPTRGRPRAAVAAAVAAAARRSWAMAATASKAAAVAADLRATAIPRWAAPEATVGRTVMTVNRVKQDKGE